MQKIVDLFEFPGDKRHKGEFGVEVEAEGKNLREIFSENWRTEDDGSLRGAYPKERAEYVLCKPLNLFAATKAIQDLAIHQQEGKALLDFSFRTSVHVHLNVQEYTEDQVLNLIYVYYLLEKPLINLCGAHRAGNRFCLRLCDGEGIYDVLLHIISNGLRSIFDYGEDGIRYSALNLAALKKYGSVEFRAMKGTLDVPTIRGWLGLIHNLGVYAKKKKNMVEIHNEFVEKPVDEFIKEVVGKEFHDLMFYDEMYNDVEYGYSLTIDLPHTYKLYKGNV